MNTQQTQLPGLTINVTAHEDPTQRLVLVTVTANDTEPTVTPTNSKVALVIDRSGSMAGQKLDITKDAVARLLRTLDAKDQVAVVTYDDSVDLVSGLTNPSDSLARLVERIHPGGSTNLYGGWLMGAKVVGPNGRVILLSDGQANAGRFSDAENLSRHAGISYRQYAITTSTIGVGQDYDEAVMAGMAMAGSGNHYFARTAESILDAFSQERFSLKATACSHVSIRIGAETVSLGHLWAGETKSVVIQVDSLAHAATIRFTEASTHNTVTQSFELPREFGHSDNVTFEAILTRIAELDRNSNRIRDPQSAREAREHLRIVLLSLMAHPLADSDVGQAVRAQTMQTIERLESLERHFDEVDASVMRKSRMQSAHNLTERAKAYSSDAGDAHVVASFARSARAPSAHVRLDPSLIALAPMDQWRRWRAFPIEKTGQTLVLAMERSRDGFLVSEIESILGLRVKTVQVSPDEIDSVLA